MVQGENSYEIPDVSVIANVDQGIILFIALLGLHHSMHMEAIILTGVYLKLPNYPQILVHKIIWGDYTRFRQNFLTFYIMPNKHKKTMQIGIGFHHVFDIGDQVWLLR